MKEKDKRPTYEPPRARDLSVSTVRGFPVPQGVCFPGGSLFITSPCTDGNNPLENPGTCNPTGLGADKSFCNAGTGPAFGCLSGGAPSP